MNLKMPDPVICDNFISGKWTKGEAGTEDINTPYSGEKLGQISLPTPSQIQQAIASAAKAQKAWAKTSLKERCKILFQVRNILLRDIEPITNLKCLESGKTFDEGRAGLMKGIEVLEFAISLQNLDLGGKLDVSKGVTCEYHREPLGVVASITPFNFPAMVPLWTMPIAIALGNAYIWKPSDKTPLTSRKIADAFQEAGLPDGILSVLHGGSITVENIIYNPTVKAIGFVGSTTIAKLVYQKTSHLGKRALALGGAKNHIILLPDANLELSGPGISDSFTGCAGQRCMAASVLLAVGDVSAHIERIVKRAGSLELGKTMGAIISKEQVEFLRGAIDRAEKAGAKILLDGRKATAPAGQEKGNWLGPTILDNIQPGSEAATTELFGPILSIIHCKDVSEALQIQQSSEYGNACSVFTESGPMADRVMREAQAGMVGVNVGVPVPREPFSFGGINASKFGHGDITGEHSLDFWSNLKKVTVKWETQSDSNWMS